MLVLERKDMKKPLIVLLVSALVACSSDPGVPEHEGEPNVVDVSETDDEMNAAMAKARSEFPKFLAEFESGAGEFSVKLRFEEEEQVEHIWMTDLVSNDEGLWGHVGNEPVRISGVAFGDRYKIEVPLVSDWLILREAGPVGGYTIRVLVSRMSAEERAAMSGQLGEFGDL